jgi:hypothetical protein
MTTIATDANGVATTYRTTVQTLRTQAQSNTALNNALNAVTSARAGVRTAEQSAVAGSATIAGARDAQRAARRAYAAKLRTLGTHGDNIIENELADVQAASAAYAVLLNANSGYAAALATLRSAETMLNTVIAGLPTVQSQVTTLLNAERAVQVRLQAPPPPQTYPLQVSTSSNRASAVPLADQTLSGNVYIFVTAESGVQQVRFFLNDPNRTGSPIRTEMTAPYDYMGATGANANALNTATLSNQAHTITAEVTLTSGEILLETAAFNVQNVAAPTTYPLLYSTNTTRINAVALNGATVSGNIYPFIAASSAGDIQQVEFWLDNPSMTGAPRRVELNAPYDVEAATNSGANPLDTKALSNGSHSIASKVTRTNATVVTATATFTVSNTTSTAPAIPSFIVRPSSPSWVYWTLRNSDTTYSGNGNTAVIIDVAEKITKAVTVSNCKYVWLRAGEFTINKPLPDGTNPAFHYHKNNNMAPLREWRCLGFSNIAADGVVLVEGCYLNNTGGGHSEGIQSGFGWGAGAILMVINTRIESCVTAPGDESNFYFNHPDHMEPMGRATYLHNISIIDVPYQGFYCVAAGTPINKIKASRVNVDTRATFPKTRQPFWVNVQSGTNVWDYSDQIYVDDKNGFRSSVGGAYLPDDKTGLQKYSGATRTITATRVEWNNYPPFANGMHINRGAPPGGDFAPANKVGRDYDPAYFGFTPW